MYKPLKKRKMSSHSGPLQKMINAEVESRMSALKATDGEGNEKEKPSQNEGKVSSMDGKFTTFDYDYDNTIEAPEEYYVNELDMTKEEYEKELGSDQVDMINERYAAMEWNKGAEEVPFDKLAPEQKESLDKFYGEDISRRDGTKILSKDGKFYLDQGTYMTNELGVTKPLEITDSAFSQPSQTSKDNTGVEKQSGSKEEPKPKVEQKFEKYGRSSSGKKDPQDIYFTVGDKTYTKQEYQQAESSGLLKTQSNMIKKFGKPMSFRNNKH